MFPRPNDIGREKDFALEAIDVWFTADARIGQKRTTPGDGGAERAPLRELSADERSRPAYIFGSIWKLFATHRSRIQAARGDRGPTVHHQIDDRGDRQCSKPAQIGATKQIY
jgi:hypothetical protein